MGSSGSQGGGKLPGDGSVVGNSSCKKGIPIFDGDVIREPKNVSFAPDRVEDDDGTNSEAGSTLLDFHKVYE